MPTRRAYESIQRRWQDRIKLVAVRYGHEEREFNNFTHIVWNTIPYAVPAFPKIEEYHFFRRRAHTLRNYLSLIDKFPEFAKLELEEPSPGASDCGRAFMDISVTGCPAEIYVFESKKRLEHQA